MNIIAIIPARGGSKRFPGKNIYPLNNKPLISYAIEAGYKAKCVDRVIVSTDSDAIAKVARDYDAEVSMRPAELATATSPVIEAIKYTLGTIEIDGYYADYIILLQPTNPVITPEQIEKAVKLAIKKKADSVITVSLVSNINHPYNIRVMLADGTMKFWKTKTHYKFMGQAKPKFYKIANLWVSTRETIMKHHHLEGKRNYAIIVDDIYSADIDYKEDLLYAETLLRIRTGSGLTIDI